MPSTHKNSMDKIEQEESTISFGRSLFVAVIALFCILFVPELASSIFRTFMTPIWGVFIGQVFATCLALYILYCGLLHAPETLKKWIASPKKPWVAPALVIGFPLSLLTLFWSLITLKIFSLAGPAVSQAIAAAFFDTTVSLSKSTSLSFCVLLFSVFVVPLMEEFLFRGYLLSALLRKWRPSIAVIVVSGLFAILHSEWIAHFILGLLLGAASLRYGSLLPSIFAHISLNFFAFFIPIVVPVLQSSANVQKILPTAMVWTIPAALFLSLAALLMIKVLLRTHRSTFSS